MLIIEIMGDFKVVLYEFFKRKGTKSLMDYILLTYNLFYFILKKTENNFRTY